MSWWLWVVTVLCAVFGGIGVLKGKHRAYLWAHVLFITMPLFVLSVVLTKLFQSKKEKEEFFRNNPLVQLAANVWICEGASPFLVPVTMTVVRSNKKNDDSLCVFTPLEPQEHTLKALAELGTVRHIVLVHFGHDTWSRKWAEVFSDAEVVCTEADREAIEALAKKQGFEIANTTSAIAKKYGIKVHESPEGSMQPGCQEEIYELPGDEKSSILLLGDTQVHMSLSPRTRDLYKFVKYTGWYTYQRVAIMYQTLFVKDPKKQKNWICKDLPSKVKNLQCVIFSHSGALESDDPDALWADLRRGANTLLGC